MESLVHDWLNAVSATLDVVNVYFEAWNPTLRFNDSKTVQRLFHMKLTLELFQTTLADAITAAAADPPLPPITTTDPADDTAADPAVGPTTTDPATDPGASSSSIFRAMFRKLILHTIQARIRPSERLSKKNLRASIRLPRNREEDDGWIVPVRNAVNDRNVVTGHMNFFFTSLDMYWKQVLKHDDLFLHERVWLLQ